MYIHEDSFAIDVSLFIDDSSQRFEWDFYYFYSFNCVCVVGQIGRIYYFSLQSNQQHILVIITMMTMTGGRKGDQVHEIKEHSGMVLNLCLTCFLMNGLKWVIYS